MAATSNLGLVRSAVKDLNWKDIPEISLAEYLLQKVESRLPRLTDKPWVVDVKYGSSVQYGDIERHSRHVACVLKHHVGFKQGDVLFCSTFECSHVYVILLAAWRLGGVTRCCNQRETIAEVARQMKETRARVVLMDSGTSTMLREAANMMDWPVTFLSVGQQQVPDTMHFTELLAHDISAYPNLDKTKVDVHRDALIITNTTGSTGRPKGAMITHYALITDMCGNIWNMTEDTQLNYSNLDNINNKVSLFRALCSGSTVLLLQLGIPRTEYLDALTKYKPPNIYMYPGIATWFARASNVTQLDLSFIKAVTLGGAFLDHTTVRQLSELLPKATVHQAYGLSECLRITHSALRGGKMMKILENEGEFYTSSGYLQPFTECKIVNVETGMAIEKRRERGEIFVRSPRLMLGYITADGKVDSSKIDADGWYHTGDIGFFDEEDCLYVTGRANFSYRKFAVDIMPEEIEAVLCAHEGVLSAGVVGVPDAEAMYLTRAYVVPLNQHVTIEELQEHVAATLPKVKHLDGGVKFLTELPFNRSKLDRIKLLEMAKVDLKINLKLTI